MTTRVCATVTLAEGASRADADRACASLGALAGRVPELERSHAGVHLEGSLGAGDLTWDVAVRDGAALDAWNARMRGGSLADFVRGAVGEGASEAASEAARAIADVEAWVVEPLARRVARPGVPGVSGATGIKRTNLVRVLPDARESDVARWSREVVALAHHVPAIRSFGLARVRAFGPTEPRVVWTHAWEQEFESLDGLLQDYMASAYHWGWLDGWYDPEVPFRIVDVDLAHLYCPLAESVLAWDAAGVPEEVAA